MNSRKAIAMRYWMLITSSLTILALACVVGTSITTRAEITTNGENATSVVLQLPAGPVLGRPLPLEPRFVANWNVLRPLKKRL